MKEELISILERHSADVFLQGTFNADEPYPQNFITFFTENSALDAYYSNDPNKIVWYVNVIFYSNNPSEVATIPKALIKDMREGGFEPQGVGFDIPSDEPNYTGWTMDFIYVERTSKYNEGD